MARAIPQPDFSFEATQWTRLFCVRDGDTVAGEQAVVS